MRGGASCRTTGVTLSTDRKFLENRCMLKVLIMCIRYVYLYYTELRSSRRSWMADYSWIFTGWNNLIIDQPSLIRFVYVVKRVFQHVKIYICSCFDWNTEVLIWIESFSVIVVWRRNKENVVKSWKSQLKFPLPVYLNFRSTCFLPLFWEIFKIQLSLVMGSSYSW